MEYNFTKTNGNYLYIYILILYNFGKILKGKNAKYNQKKKKQNSSSNLVTSIFPPKYASR